MQKSTIFIVMLAVISITIIGKLFAYDYLRQGWANIFYGEPEQTWSLKTFEAPMSETPADSAVQPAVDAETRKEAQSKVEETARPENLQNIDGAAKPFDAQKLLEELKLDFEKATSEQLTEAGFEKAKIIPAVFGNRIFQLVDTADITNADSGEFNISDEKNIYATVVEMQFQTQLETEDVYNLIKKRLQGLTGITINESNQFGNGSFFMNDSKRPANAFLVVMSGNHLYAYTYPKANHEFIKKLIILLNQ